MGGEKQAEEAIQNLKFKIQNSNFPDFCTGGFWKKSARQSL